MLWNMLHMQPLMENTHLYSMIEMQRAQIAPLRLMAKLGQEYHRSMFSPFHYTGQGKFIAAGLELLERTTRRYAKPDFGITETEIEGRKVPVTEEVALSKPFCNLLHFKRAPRRKDPKILMIAPMSGHHATLLRGTVKGMLPHAEVYITDWTDAREVPLFEGTFDFDDFVDYIIEFIDFLGENVHVMAVCQPSVPALAAAAIMAAEKHPHQPATMTLMGGPIDARQNPTEVNKLAETKSLEWFERNVVTRVPVNHPGFLRRVYPGFLQLTGFMQLNLDRHIGEHMGLFNHLVEGDGESARAHKEFYNEYLSVMDLPAEFYLQTIRTVFQEYALPKGTLVSRGRKVDPSKIKKTALLCIEGERDDISGLGQTKAAIDLCSGLAKSRKKYYMQKEVGHYGIFNGRRFRNFVRPQIVDWIQKFDK